MKKEPSGSASGRAAIRAAVAKLGKASVIASARALKKQMVEDFAPASDWITEECWCGCTILHPTDSYWSEDAVTTEYCLFHDPASTPADREAWRILKGAA